MGYRYISMILFTCMISCDDRRLSGNGDSKAGDSVLVENSSEHVSIWRLIKQSGSKHILKVDKCNDTLSVVSDGELTWKPLTVTAMPDTVMVKLGGMRKTDTTYVSFDGKKLFSAVSVTSLAGKFIFRKLDENKPEYDDVEHKGEERKPYMLYYAQISRTGTLSHGIKIGMKKEDFYRAFLGVYDEALFKNISVVVNSDPRGEELDTYFTFEGPLISGIEMCAPL